MLISSPRTFWMSAALLTWLAPQAYAAPSPRKRATTSPAARPAPSRAVVSKPKATKQGGAKAKGLPASVLFTVNGEPFPYRTYQVTMLSVRYRLRMNWATIKRMKIDRLVLNQLIDRMVMAQEARRRGYKATAEQVRKKMRASKSFRRRGKFSKAIFQRILKYMGVTEKTYIRIMQNRMLAEQLRSKLLQSIPLKETESWAAFQKQFTRLRVRVASLDVQGLTKAYEKQLSAATIDRYIKKNLSKLRLLYMLTRARRYQRKEKVRARHILLRLSPKASPKKVAEVTRKMNRLLGLLKRVPTFFPRLARRFSQGPSKTRGGDLGFFGRGQMVKAFEKAAFALKKPNDISKIVRTRFGLHIIQLVARQPAVNRPFGLPVQRELARNLIVRAKTSALANNAIQRWQKKLQTGKWTWAQFRAHVRKKPTSRPTSQPSSRPASRAATRPAQSSASWVRSFVTFRVSPFFTRGKANSVGLRQSARGKKQDVFALTLAKPYLPQPVMTEKRMEIWRLDARKPPTKATFAMVKKRWNTALKRKKLRKVQKQFVKKLRKNVTIRITRLPLIRRF